MLENIQTEVETNKGLEIITRLRSQGISITKKGEQINCKSPKGLIAKSDIEALKNFKNEIIKILEEESNLNIVVPDLESRFEPFPLTDVQSAYLLGRSNAFEYGGVACHIYLELKYPELDPKRAKYAWIKLVERHDMLRATISKEATQKVHEKVPDLEVRYFDASELSDEEIENRLFSIRENMGHKVYETEKWPLFEVAITKIHEYSILHFSIEFLIADGASVWFLLSEFEDLYYETDREFPDLELTFRDYVITERKMKYGNAYFRDRKYWLERIDQLPPAPDLPLNIDQASQDSPLFSRRLFFLEGKDWDTFKSRVQKHGLTPTGVILAVYSSVLARWSKNNDFCINLTVLNRQPLHQQVYDIIGDFTSVSLLEINWSNEKSFLDQAKKINIQLFSDLNHRLFSGVEVLREIARRKGRETALMPVVFTSAIGIANNDNSYQLKGEVLSNSISQTPQVFIDCQATDTEHGIKINWDIREGIFPDKLVDDMFDTFKGLLLSLVHTDEVWKNKIQLHLPEYQIIERIEANNTHKEIESGLLHTKLLDKIDQNSSQTAIIDQDGFITYKTLGQRGAAVVAKLKQLGCKTQEPVAISLEKGSYQVAAVLGILSVQGVYVPVDMMQPKIRRESILEQSGIRFVVTHSKNQTEWPKNIQLIEIDKLEPELETKLEANGYPNLPAYIIFTSGSTGTPKGVVISHKSALNTIEDINQRYKVTKDDKILSLSQLGFDLSVYDIFGLLSEGGTIVFPNTKEANNPSHWLQLLDKYKITLWNTVPALMQMLLSCLSSEKNYQLPKLRTAFLSGDWIPINLPEQIIKHVPSLKLISLGGATEASIWSIFHEYKGLQPHWSSIPYGKPLSNQGFRVLDTNMLDCPIWVTGELSISGTGLAQGYLKNPKMTTDRFFNHPVDGQRLYRTGDQGRYLPGGEIEFLGREDNQVKIRGHRIELGEIEAVLQKHPGVSNAEVVVDGTGDDRALLGVVETTRLENQIIDYRSENFKKLIQNINEEVSPSGNFFNNCIQTCIEKISQTNRDKTLRILEVGVQSDTVRDNILSSLKNRKIDYLITDANPEIVAKTQTYYSGRDYLKFAFFDINEDYRKQGLEPNNFDLVLVSKIPENSSGVQHAIDNITQLISPNGYLIAGYSREMRDANVWFDVLKESFNNHPNRFFSDDSTGLTLGLFLTNVKINRAKIDVMKLKDFVAQHLPAHMIPTCLQVVDNMPLTTNGKIDRKILAKWRPIEMQSISAEDYEQEEMDELETKMVEIWSSALGVKSISNSQNIIELGVDSLIMARIAGNTREMLNELDSITVDISFDNLLRQILNFPTIKDLSTFIRSEQSKQSTSSDCTLTEQISEPESNGIFTNYGGGEDGPLRVVFHAGLGTLNSYALLLDHLANQNLGPTIGVSIKDIETYCDLDPANAVEHIAEDYAKHIASIGRNEVQLIGHCTGGFTATEVSRRLLERGVAVRDLVIIDTIPQIPVEDDWILEIIFVFAAGISIDQCGFGEITPEDLRQALEKIISNNPNKIPHGSVLSLGGNELLDKVCSVFQNLNQTSTRERFSRYSKVMNNVHAQDVPVEMLEGLYKCYKHSFRASQLSLEPYLGDVRFLLAEVTFSFLPLIHERGVDYWKDLVIGNFQVGQITGDHNTCIEQEPHVSKLADLIKVPLLK